MKVISAEMTRTWIVWIFVALLSLCDAVIHHLNDTEYPRLPPLWSLDEYESCLVEEGSTYCMLQLTLYAEPGNELMQTIMNYSDDTMRHYDHKVIDKGVCVKKTCSNYIDNSTTTEDQRFFLEECLNNTLRREYGLSANVSKLYYCNKHNEPVIFDTWDWTVLGVILGLVTLNIIGTLYDNHLRRQGRIVKKGFMFLLSFSVTLNWKRLIDTETNSSKTKDLRFFHAVRVISNLSTILLHSMMIFTIGFTQNSHFIEKTYDLPSFNILYSGLAIVQLFFFKSGFLKSNDFLYNDEKRSVTILDLSKTILLRLSRSMPALAVTLALATSWVRHIGSGPLWKLYVTDSLVADCRSYWWQHLLFINNYAQGGKYCLIPTWHLAAEMQVFLVGVAAFLMSRRVLLPVLLLLAALAPAVHTILQDLDAVIATPQFLRTWDSRSFWLLNVLGHNSLACFIMGMITSSCVYEWRKQGKHLVTSWWWSLMQYVSIALIPLLLYSGHMFYADGERKGVVSRAVYNSAIRVLIGLTYVLATYAFINKSTSFLKWLFEWRWWMVPSRLTYCVFLLHMILVHIMMGSRTHLSYYSFSNMVHATCVVGVISYLLAVPLYLMVEVPFTTLCKQLVHSPVAKYKEDKVE